MKKYLLCIAAIILLMSASSAHAQVVLPNPIPGIQDIPAVIDATANYIAGIIVALAGLMFVWAAILFLTSGLYPSNLDKAKQTLFWAVVGLGITLAARGLLALVQQLLRG